MIRSKEALLLASLLLLVYLWGSVQGVSRIRLSNVTEGVIATPNDYQINTNCSWFLETNNTRRSYVRLKFNYFLTECLWDYLHIFNGDSIYSPKLAAYSGEVLHHDATPGSIDGGSGSMYGSGDVTYVSPNEVVLSFDSPHVLFHFFSDAEQVNDGFNISYWVSTCISNCSNNGFCDESKGACQCEPDWTGQYCQTPACPNNCNHHGNCINKQCICDEDYTGTDCSILTDRPHWTVMNVSNTDTVLLSRAGHTSVLWEGSMWVFGGYQFDGTFPEALVDGSGERDEGRYADLLQYDINDNDWMVIEPIGVKPRPRYGHSAVVYKDYMYIYGGALIPSEEITNELWRYDFHNMNWTEIDQCRVTSDNDTESSVEYCPIRVKDHTANVIGDKMIIIFGYTDQLWSDNGRIEIPNFVQEFDLVNESWPYPPPQYGNIPSGRMAHSSVYVPETGLLYIYGGEHLRDTLSSIIAYDPVTNYWSRVISEGTLRQSFHRTLLMNGALVSFGGYTTSDDCFSSELVIYDILQNEWRTLSLPGLPGNASRYSYSAVSPDNTTLLVYGGFKGSTFHDVLVFKIGKDCSEYGSESSCTGSLCRWYNNSTCTDISLERNIDTGSYCHLYISCSSCNTSSSTDCQWIDDKCQYIDPTSNTTAVTSAAAATSSDPSCSESRLDSCSHYLSCVSCVAHEGCGWTQSGCKDRSNDTITSCSVTDGCSGHTSCSSCTGQGNCLWCSSLNKCVDTGVYPYLFPFGQCLGWTRSCSSTTEDCSDHLTCAECRTESGCGWCRDESDTGLGTCGKGGFLKSLNGSFCVNTHWFYDSCPLCNCNGHSECVNKSVCVDCQNNTRGANCELCEDGYFGRPVNGRSCSVCDCNGYNTVCDTSRGNCTCLDAGVTGTTCTLCKGVENYRGNASNFCYYTLSVGFIYTFLSPDVETQNFFVARPRASSRLNVKFEISRNRYDSSISVQYFLGRFSQDYDILYNLTDVLTISGTNSHSETYESFSSVTFNSSNLFSFARPHVQSTAGFGWLFGNASSNDFTSNLWDGDVALIIYVFNLKPNLQYKITVDQNDLTFLIYFFVTFLTCFTLLLSLFLLGWYIKRKLEIRALIRAQHIEMQRRVRRPFARIKAIVDTPSKSRTKQIASYVAVETVGDSKAAILSVLIRLPSDKATGHPKPNRTGMCFGSTFVRMNPPKKKRTKHSSHNLNT